MSNAALGHPHFVVNGRPRRRHGAAALDSARAAALRAFPNAVWTLTSGPGEAQCLAAAAARLGASFVAAVGGDGTINEVANGLLTAGVHPPPALGIIPAGSGSDFSRSLGLPRDPARAVDVLRGSCRRRVDVGCVECSPLATSRSSVATTRFFLNIAGCGTSARVTERFNAGRVPGSLGYASAAVRTVFDFPWPRVRIQLDDEPEREVELNLLFACNGEYCGGGMRVGRGARLDDGLLQVVEASGIGRLRTVLEWPRLYGGRLAHVRGVRVASARRLRVASEADVSVDCDGEVCGRLPAVYRVLPAALTVIAPPSSESG